MMLMILVWMLCADGQRASMRLKSGRTTVTTAAAAAAVQVAPRRMRRTYGMSDTSCPCGVGNGVLIKGVLPLGVVVVAAWYATSESRVRASRVFRRSFGSDVRVGFVRLLLCFDAT